MKRIKCKEFTGFNCSYEIDGSLYEKIKIKFKKHLKEQHNNQNKEQMNITDLQIREVIGKVDTQIMGRNKEQIYNYNKV